MRVAGGVIAKDASIRYIAPIQLFIDRIPERVFATNAMVVGNHLRHEFGGTREVLVHKSRIVEGCTRSIEEHCRCELTRWSPHHKNCALSCTAPTIRPSPVS